MENDMAIGDVRQRWSLHRRKVGRCRRVLGSFALRVRIARVPGSEYRSLRRSNPWNSSWNIARWTSLRRSYRFGRRELARAFSILVGGSNLPPFDL
jgi:hypothetical protein